MGQPKARRHTFSSICDPKWTLETATEALRRAIQAGLVSEEWKGDFPRYAWHREDAIVYQAFLSNETLGEYHAYPLEDDHEWPKGMR